MFAELDNDSVGWTYLHALYGLPFVNIWFSCHPHRIQTSSTFSKAKCLIEEIASFIRKSETLFQNNLNRKWQMSIEVFAFQNESMQKWIHQIICQWRKGCEYKNCVADERQVRLTSVHELVMFWGNDKIWLVFIKIPIMII